MKTIEFKDIDWHVLAQRKMRVGWQMFVGLKLYIYNEDGKEVEFLSVLPNSLTNGIKDYIEGLRIDD